MKIRNLINHFSEKIKKFGGNNSKLISRLSYISVFAVVLTFVVSSYTLGDKSASQLSKSSGLTSNNLISMVSSTPHINVNKGDSKSNNSASDLSNTVTSVSEVQAASVASMVASAANLSSANNVSSDVDSLNIISEMGQADVASVTKKQISESASDVKSIVDYEVKEGENAETIANKFNVSPETVRWANNLTDNNINPGTTILVPTLNGIVYKFKENDKLLDVVNRYGANFDNVVTVNDINGDSVAAGQVILLPDVSLPENERPGYVAPRASTSANSMPAYIGNGIPAQAGNRYYAGQCTWYAYNRRVSLGLPVASNWGNANTWAAGAMRAGYLVDRNPSVGSIFQTATGYYGHVGIVEAVNPDGSIRVSEMNYHGAFVQSERTITNTGDYYYIH